MVAILSDAGYILFDDKPLRAREYAFAKKHLGVSVGEEEFLASIRELRDRAQVGKQSTQALFREYLADQERENLHETYDRFVADYVAGLDITNLLFPGVHETLDVLSQQEIPFVVVTDSSRGVEQLRREVYDPLNLTSRVTGIISSKDVGAKKPDAKIFDEAMTRYNLNPEETFFVAHDLDELEGANRYGLKVIALRYEPKLRENGTLDFVKENGGYFIERFSDLLQILKLK